MRTCIDEVAPYRSRAFVTCIFETNLFRTYLSEDPRFCTALVSFFLCLKGSAVEQILHCDSWLMTSSISIDRWIMHRIQLSVDINHITLLSKQSGIIS